MLKSFLNPGKGYQKGQQQLDKYYQQAQQQMQPYNQNAQNMYGQLSDATTNLLNPSSLMDKWLNDYEMSDQAQFAQNRAMDSGQNAASAMGLVGSSPALQALQYGQNEIGAQDEQRYIDRMIQQYLQGAGLAQNIYGQGANAAGAMSNNAMNMGSDAANMAFGRQNAPGKMFADLLGTGAGLAGSYMGMQGMNNMAKAWNTGGGR